MTDTVAGNGNKRFEDLLRRVDGMDAKMDLHAETLAEIKALLGGRPCVGHDSRLREVETRTGILMGGAQVSSAKVSGLAAVISAVVAAIGYFFMSRGS
jgi:hypothetical protein